MATLARESEPAPLGSGTVVRLRRAWLSEVEIGTTMTERQFGVWLNPLWETMTTGRRPVCSEPDLRTRSAQKTSPRFNEAPHAKRSSALSMRFPGLHQGPKGCRRIPRRTRKSLRGAQPFGDDGAKV